MSVPASRSRHDEDELGCKLDITFRSLLDLLLPEAGDSVRFRLAPPKAPVNKNQCHYVMSG